MLAFFPPVLRGWWMAAGAKVKATFVQGRRPFEEGQEESLHLVVLHYAAHYGSRYVLQLLLHWGANPHGAWTPLNSAVELVMHSVVKNMWLIYSCSPAWTRKYNWERLHPTMKLALVTNTWFNYSTPNAVGDLNMPNNWLLTPLLIGQRREHMDIVSIMNEASKQH